MEAPDGDLRQGSTTRQPGGVRIGCAGWSIPGREAARFPGPGTHLERYARVFTAVEIDSSFYRSHRPQTYERWARSVPEGFRFAVKAPRDITHVRRLSGIAPLLRRFLEEIAPLGGALGPILLQLPPSLAFDERRARACFEELRALHTGPVACEPRHASWFAPGPERLQEAFRIARVAADPARVPAAGRPGGWAGLAYYRLHGSPQLYRSAYTDAFLASLAADLRALAGRAEVWCIFDNTAAGAAIPDALRLTELVSARF